MELYLNVVTVTVTAELPLYDDAFYNRFVAHVPMLMVCCFLDRPDTGCLKQ